MKKPDAGKVSLRMESIWLEAENRIIQDVVRRIHKNSKITSTADYQLNRVKELGRSTEEIEKILKESLNATYPEMYKLYDFSTEITEEDKKGFQRTADFMFESEMIEYELDGNKLFF